jgi:hypothetical protein
MGIWLLQEDVELASGQFTCTDPTDGCHNVGDVLVESEFTNGGGDVTINVYEWVGAGAGDSGSHDELDQLVGGGTGFDCSDLAYNGMRDDPVCATVNDGSTPVPATGHGSLAWTYDAKEVAGSPDANFPAGTFFEGGANLSEIFGDELGCFSDVVIKTSESQEVTDALNDFTFFNDIKLGCVTTTVTTPSSATVALGDSVSDRAVVSGNRRGGDPTGTVSFSACGPMASGLCQTGGTLVSTETLVSDGSATTFTSTATSDPFRPTTPGRYCFRGEYSGDDAYPASADFSETECFMVAKAPSSTVTTPSSDSVVLGDSVSDRAVVGGNAAGGPPTGTVSFFVCGPLSDPAATCASGGISLGVKTLAAIAGTNNSQAESNAFTPTAPGRYCFRGRLLG